MVRRDRTRDRDFVAKAAALLIKQDFGLLGTFDSWPAEDEPGEDKPVAVNLKGAGLGVPLDRWIKKGDVFAVVQMPLGDAAPGKPVHGALLRWRRRRPATRLLRLPPLPPLRGARATPTAPAIAASNSARSRRRCGFVCCQALPIGGSGPLKDSAIRANPPSRIR